jgi:hypothetical protein
MVSVYVRSTPDPDPCRPDHMRGPGSRARRTSSLGASTSWRVPDGGGPPGCSGPSARCSAAWGRWWSP